MMLLIGETGSNMIQHKQIQALDTNSTAGLRSRRNRNLEAHCYPGHLGPNHNTFPKTV